MDIGDQKKGNSGINFPSVPLANLKNVALLQKRRLLFTHNLWVIHVKTLCRIFLNCVCLGKLQKIEVITMLVWNLFIWTWYHQDAYRSPLMTGGWITLTSVDTKDAAQCLCFLLGILTIVFTAGTGYEAFYNTGPCPVRAVWRGLALVKPFLYFSFNSVLECEVTVCPSAFYSWTWSIPYWKFLFHWSCLCDSLQDQGSKVLVAHSPKLDFFVSKQDKWVGPQMQTWMMLGRATDADLNDAGETFTTKKIGRIKTTKG